VAGMPILRAGISEAYQEHPGQDQPLPSMPADNPGLCITNYEKFGILHSSVYTFFEKVCIIEFNSDVETGNLKLGNASTSLYFFQFPISSFTAKIQDQQSVNYF
jgi:hypothetical protein